MDEDASVLSRTAAELDAVLSWGPGPEDVADVRLGSDSRPLVVVLHGGFWRPTYDRAHVRPMTEAISAAGWTVVAPEYRRAPGRPDLTCDDVRVALRVLPVELRGRHDGRVVVMGHSAGGHLALWAAAVAPASGLLATVALAPVADLLAADRESLGDGAVGDFLGAAASTRGDLDPVRMASPATSVLILHGVDDEIVPLRQSQAYADAHPLVHPGSPLRAIPGAGHFDLIDPVSPHWADVVAALVEVSAA